MPTQSARHPRVLFVDDQDDVLRSLVRVARGRFDALTAPSAMEAIAIISSTPDLAVVVSDHDMPGMRGVELLRSIRDIAPDVTRVMLTGRADLTVAAAAVNEGSVFRFITKPVSATDLLRALTDAAELHRLRTAERELLERTLHGSIKALTDVLAMLHPQAFGRALRVKRLVGELGKRLELEPLWEVEVAAMLSQVGLITLPTATVDRLLSGAPLGIRELTLVQKAPEVAVGLIAEIPRLDGVRTILRHQEIRYDGTGAPQPTMRGEALPAGSRLLKLILDFDALECSGIGMTSALDALESRRGWYDRRLVCALRELHCSEHRQQEIREMMLAEVAEGMLFASDVLGSHGVLLVARGQEVTRSLLERIRHQWSELSTSTRVRMVVSSGPSSAPREAEVLARA